MGRIKVYTKPGKLLEAVDFGGVVGGTNSTLLNWIQFIETIHTKLENLVAMIV